MTARLLRVRRRAVDEARRLPRWSGTTAELVTAAIDLLAAEGPTLGRPVVDRVKGSARHNMKELRPGSTGRTEVRILFVFDPERKALLLVAGDKSGRSKDWYRTNIPVAEPRYEQWPAGDRAEEV